MVNVRLPLENTVDVANQDVYRVQTRVTTTPDEVNSSNAIQPLFTPRATASENTNTSKDRL